jgi:flagellar P-ring protein FlgI
MKKTITKILFTTLLLSSLSAYAASVRLKNITHIKGVRENPIIGYGLIVGLNGTGDGGGEITNTSLKRMFQKLGLNPQSEISSKNVAAVIVTAKLPPFARSGQKIDITVSSIGDAASLAGGTLLVTPLKGGDGQNYAIANGPVTIGGLNKGARFATTGRIPGGGVVEKELSTDFLKKKSLRIGLNNPDFTTAARIQKIINSELGGKFAQAKDATTIDLIVPIHYQRKVVDLIAILENFKVNTDSSAKIVINERTGTLVLGGEIAISEVAIGHGDLTISIEGEGDKEGGDTLYHVEKRTKLKDLVKALNLFGTDPEDLISIFQALKQNGALIGDIEII